MSHKRIIYRPCGEPLPDDSHLEFRMEKGDIRMKVTVNADGPEFVGRRILIPLHTKDVETARKIRDGILVALVKAGVLSRSVNADEEPLEGDNSMPRLETKDM